MKNENGWKRTPEDMSGQRGWENDGKRKVSGLKGDAGRNRTRKEMKRENMNAVEKKSGERP